MNSTSNNDGWTTVGARRNDEDRGNRAFGSGMGRRVLAAGRGFGSRQQDSDEYTAAVTGASPFGRRDRDEGRAAPPAFGRRDRDEGRVAPAAFGRQEGGGNSFTKGSRDPKPPAEGASAFAKGPRDDRRAEQRAMQQAAEAAEAEARRAAVEAERKRMAEATNFTSQASYPALGYAGPAAKAAPKMNYAAKVAEMAAREAEKELQRQLEMEQLAHQEEMDRALGIKKQTPAPKLRVLDDGQGDDFSDIEDEEEKEEEDDGEFNAHLHGGRRRGDKGVW